MASNIKENILKMKNLSELIVDLSYSALFLESKGLNKEVFELYEKIQELEKDTLKMLFKVRVADEKRISIIELMDKIKTISDSACDISSLTEKETPKIIKEVLTKTTERVIVTSLVKNSVLSNKTFGETELRSRINANVVAIKRNNDWLFDINGDTLVKSGDQLVAVGPEEAEELLKKLAKGKLKSLPL